MANPHSLVFLFFVYPHGPKRMEVTCHSTWHLLWRQTLVLKSSGSHEKPMKFWRELGSLPNPKPQTLTCTDGQTESFPSSFSSLAMAKSCKGLALELVKCLSDSPCIKVTYIRGLSFFCCNQSSPCSFLFHSLCTISKFPGGNNASQVVNWILVTFLSSVRNNFCVIRIMCISSIASCGWENALCRKMGNNV